MNLLIASHIGLPWGGVTQRYSDLIKSSLSSKINLTFFESTPNSNLFSSSGKISGNNILRAIKVYFEFISVLLSSNVEVVLIATAQGTSFVKNSILVLISKIFRKKVIVSPHCSIKVFLPDKNRIWQKMVLFVLNHCDGIIIFSKEWFVLSNLLQRPKIFCLPNSIDLSKYALLNAGAENSSSLIQIIYLGHLGREKGIFDLVEAIKILSKDQTILNHFRFDLYGESLRQGEFEELESLVKGYGLEPLISFHSPEFGDKKIEIFRNASIFVIPSHHEGMPVSIIEAMAAGLPIIATNVGGIPDLVCDQVNGLLVPKDAPAVLAETLKYLINHPELRKEMGENSKKQALANHEIEGKVDFLIEFLNEVNEKGHAGY